MTEPIVEVGRACPFCGKPTKVLMPLEAYRAWQAGAYVQVAWPQGTADEREVLISGTCAKCWDEMIPDEDEDEDEILTEDEWRRRNT